MARPAAAAAESSIASLEAGAFAPRPEMDGEEFTVRQQAVLAAALDVLAESGDNLTMASVARRARCSKETLYKWFGDRNGLLTATVQWQAAKVRVPKLSGPEGDAASLRRRLEQFARDLLQTLVGEVSITLNRLAVGRAGSEPGGLGKIVLENGPLAIRRRLTPLLHAGQAAGWLRFQTADDAFRTFFGLVVADTQIRLLLGDKTLGRTDIEAVVRAATDQFFTLYGAGSSA